MSASLPRAFALAIATLPFFLAPAPARAQTGGFLESATATAYREPLSTATLQEIVPTRGRFTFPAPYSTIATRLTNAADCGGSDCVDYVGYSYWSNINNHAGSDTMLIFLGLNRSRGGAGPTLFTYNKTTGETRNAGALFDAGDPLSWSTGEGWYFSATAPSALYINDGPRMLRYDVLARSAQTVYDVRSLLGRTDVYLWQMHSSGNDRVHSATVKHATTFQPLGCVTYREDTGFWNFFPSIGDFDECQIDKSGRWLLIKDNLDGRNGEDNRVVDLDTGLEQVFYDEDGAAGHSDAGFGYMVAEDNYAAQPGAVRVWRFNESFTAPGQGTLVYYLTSWSSGLGHIAHGNAQSNLPLNQQTVCSSNATRLALPRVNEIVCYRLDGSLQVLIVAPNMTNLDAPGGGSDDYAKLPKGNRDVSGEYFIWTSNLGSNRLDAFIVHVPEAMLTGGGARVNVAAASAGASASASSTYGAAYAPSGANNGDRKGLNWGAGGGWNDDTLGAFADWLQVDFSGSKTINEIDVFTLQDVYAAPSTPTPSMTFTQYGIRDFDVQYWNGSGWQTIPGGSVTGNNLVWRQFTFAPVTTPRIRVLVNDALASYSRITEVEAWESAASGNQPPTVVLTGPADGAAFTAPAAITLNATAGDTDGTVTSVSFRANGSPIGSDTTSPYRFDWSSVPAGSYTLTAVATDDDGATTTSATVNVTVNPPGGGLVNVAAAAAGATASASSSYAEWYPPSGAINGDRKGLNWGAGGGWNDETLGVFPDWLQIDFGGSKTISEIDVFTLQDSYVSPSEPTLAMTFIQYGLRDFEAQYWNGATWQTIPGTAVTNNDKVWRHFAFGSITTPRIRILVSSASAGYSRITEVEVWGAAAAPGTQPSNVAAAAAGAVASATSVHSVAYGPDGAIDGDRRGLRWGAGGGWNDGTAGLFPDSLQIDFNGTKTLSEVDVFTVQDVYWAPSVPTETMTFTEWGIRGFEVQYWNGSAWQTIPGTAVTNNNLVWRKFTFSPITTVRVRVVITDALSSYSRIAEVEAWGTDAVGGSLTTRRR